MISSPKSGAKLSRISTYGTRLPTYKPKQSPETPINTNTLPRTRGRSGRAHATRPHGNPLARYARSLRSLRSLRLTSPLRLLRPASPRAVLSQAAHVRLRRGTPAHPPSPPHHPGGSRSSLRLVAAARARAPIAACRWALSWAAARLMCLHAAQQPATTASRCRVCARLAVPPFRRYAPLPLSGSCGGLAPPRQWARSLRRSRYARHSGSRYAPLFFSAGAFQWPLPSSGVSPAPQPAQVCPLMLSASARRSHTFFVFAALTATPAVLAASPLRLLQGGVFAAPLHPLRPRRGGRCFS